MSTETGIGWTDSTFNPWMGCTAVSPACDHCYAQTLVEGRFKRAEWGPGKPRVRTSAANRDRLLARQAEQRRSRKAGPDSAQWAVKKLVSDAARRARARGLPFSITPADLAMPSHCPLLGLPLVYQATGRRVAGSASLDRIDSSDGYTKGNVWIVSWRANQIKSDATPDELRRIADAHDRKAASGNLLDGVKHEAFPI